MAKDKTENIKKFLEATKRGWEYSLDNVDEIVELIHQKYAQDKTVEALMYEDKITKELMLLNLFDIGEVNKELSKRLYKQLMKSGKVKKIEKLDNFTFDDVIKNTENTNSTFTKEEKKYLLKKGNIKLCVNPNWMPFEGEKDGKYIGIVADYFDLVKKEFDINIEIQLKTSWDKTLASMKNGECDIIGTASPTPGRMTYMNFTEAYMKSPIVLITKIDKPFINHIEDVSKRKLGITSGYAIEEILRGKYPDMNIVGVENIEDGLKKVESGEIYGYIDNLSVTVANIQKAFNGVLKVSARLEESDDLTIGSRNDEPMLNSIFQKVIRSIDEAKVRKILNEWISVKESVGFDYDLFKKMLVLFFVFLVIVFIYAYQLKKYNKKLKVLSNVDTLTQISNRLKLDEVLEIQQKTAIRYKATCGIIILDIDNFKKINDTHGHLVGDEVLKQLALTLKYNIRGTDTVGRWGGEEFLVMCPHTDIENLKNVAENLREKIDKSIFNKKQHITASFGLSCLDGVKDMEQVINEADKALYISKTNGKNQVTVFSPSNFDF